MEKNIKYVNMAKGSHIGVIVEVQVKCEGIEESLPEIENLWKMNFKDIKIHNTRTAGIDVIINATKYIHIADLAGFLKYLGDHEFGTLED